MEDMVPRDDHHPDPPRFARSHFIAFHNDVPHGSSHRWDRIRIGIYQDRLQARIVIVLKMQQENAGVGGNGDFDFISHFQTAAALEVFFGDKDLNGSLQLLLLRRGQPLVVENISLDDGQPGWGKGL
jgi:hypothetical protein